MRAGHMAIEIVCSCESGSSKAEAVGARLELAFVFDKDGRRALIEEPDPEAKPVR